MTFLHRRTVLRAAAGSALAGAAGTAAAGCGGDRTAAGPPSATPRGTGRGAAARVPALPGPPLLLPALPAGLPAQIEHGSRRGQAVALTFHGRGDAKSATALLAEAERAGARVTVLAVGDWLDAEPRMARRVLDGGHELGNHTMRHLSVCSMPAKAAYAEIAECADRLRRLTGGIGRWFRPSRARRATDQVVRLARQAGYPHILSYDVDSLDFTDPGAEAVRRTVLGAVRPGSVVSLHFGHAGTVAALPAILDGLHRRGLRAVTTTELLTR
ncbi:polysaccharide deacetylase family protein [Streptomyces abikoensis]|uniref:Polysaccharide deacetylase family protein n=1 Tax=Streptomyces abikoensis TaxID=97398 RepID=A0ABW7T6A2_9ACTN|nr:polysaccharide deacetylase family protein [Streptomyces luteoverticillatus]